MAAKFTDYYELLGIPRTASLEEIKQAYRKLAREHHPDLHPEKDKELHTRRMQEANEAYSVLSSPENRAKYDQFGEHWKEGPPPSAPRREESYGTQDSPPDAQGFSDFFENFFRQGGADPSARDLDTSERDVEAELQLTLEEAVRGVEKSFTLMTTGLCQTCHGTGRVGKSHCPVCGGVGEIRQPRNIKTKIPAGLLDGGRIRLKGKGNAGPRGSGDLFLTIHLAADPRYKVNGRDLTTDVVIRPWQAALGSETTISTLDGPVRVRIPKKTHTGTRLRLAGKGLGKPGSRGDLYIQFEIDIADALSPEVEALYRQLSAKENANG